MASDETTVEPFPRIELAQSAFILSQPRFKHQHTQARQSLLDAIDNDEMAPYYIHLTSGPTPLLGKPDSALLDSLKLKNADQLKLFDDKLKDAQDNLGETEIADVHKAKATYLARIGEKEEAIAAYDVALAKTVGLGSKIDLSLSKIRVGLFFMDHKLITQSITKTQELVDGGGDWDRKNRLKVYQGYYYLSIRNFSQAATLLLDALSTFTATELVPYETFVQLAIVAGVFSLERPDLKKKIIASPEVLGVQAQLPQLFTLANTLYNRQYKSFLRTLVQVEQLYLIPSRLLSLHAQYYVRELRIKAYSQLLESYQSVTLSNLASIYGLDKSFLDKDISRFIATGRLGCTIDKVSEIVETNRQHARSAEYDKFVRDSNGLLNRVEQLSRAIG